jgi:hypothetical protein
MPFAIVWLAVASEPSVVFAELVLVVSSVGTSAQPSAVFVAVEYVVIVLSGF